MTANPGPNRRHEDPPAGLSPWARRVWTELVTANDFGRHELVTFERALRWWGVSDRLMQESEPLTGRERDAKLKAAADAATAALRHWRTLKFVDPARPVRPGRPSGEDWSEKRKLGHRRLQALGGDDADR
jgi:hypothetical protein